MTSMHSYNEIFDESIRHKLIYRNMPLAAAMGKKAAKKYLKWDDELIAEAYAILCFIVLDEKFDWDETKLRLKIGKELWVYSHNYVCKKTLYQERRSQGLKVAKYEYGNNKDTSKQIITESQLQLIIEEILKTGIEKTVYRWYMENWTDEEIAKELGRGKRHIRDIRISVMEKIERYCK